jgi:hypothetical protein
MKNKMKPILDAAGYLWGRAYGFSHGQKKRETESNALKNQASS